MLKMSPFLTFLLYCMFVGFSVYYLTKDNLDENSRYILIGVLILPYIFMDQLSHFNQDNSIESNITIDTVPKNIQHPQENYSNFAQPKIELNNNEKVENLKILEEIKKKELALKEQQERLKQERLKQEKQTFTLEEVQKLLNSVKKETPKVIENYGSAYNGDVEEKYNEDNTFTDQSLNPLGENGNGLTNAWDHDYILLNTDKWAPALKPTPVCKAEKTCPVCPNMTSGYPLMLRDFNDSRKVTPPIEANTPSMNA